jgi:hypothetical protein
MKPQREFGPSRRRACHDGRDTARRSLIEIERNYHPGRFRNYFGGQGSPWRRPSFSSLAKEALRADANRTFALETAVLGFITVVSAWPIAIMIQEVIRLIR